MTIAVVTEDLALPKKRSRVLSKFLKQHAVPLVGGRIVLFFILAAIIGPYSHPTIRSSRVSPVSEKRPRPCSGSAPTNSAATYSRAW